MVQQKIVMKVQMNCEKGRTKAMKIAAVEEGVNSLAIEGSDKDQLVVIGEGVDSANLTCSLRKKLCHATLLSVEEVKEKKKEPQEKPKPPDQNPKPNCICCPQCYQYPPFPMSCEVVYDPSPSCIIM
ncbi:heavy metal-associated isoprenylated plant protein 47-like [Fagus crenata]